MIVVQMNTDSEGRTSVLLRFLRVNVWWTDFAIERRDFEQSLSVSICVHLWLCWIITAEDHWAKVTGAGGAKTVGKT
jgi:hypothetical protein